MKIDINNIPNIKMKAEWKRENVQDLSSLPNDDLFQQAYDSLFQTLATDPIFSKRLFEDNIIMNLINHSDNITLDKFIYDLNKFTINIKKDLTLNLIFELIINDREDILLYLVKCGLVVRIPNEDDERIPKVLKYINKIKNKLTLLNDEKS